MQRHLTCKQTGIYVGMFYFCRGSKGKHVLCELWGIQLDESSRDRRQRPQGSQALQEMAANNVFACHSFFTDGTEEYKKKDLTV